MASSASPQKVVLGQWRPRPRPTTTPATTGTPGHAPADGRLAHGRRSALAVPIRIIARHAGGRRSRRARTGPRPTTDRCARRSSQMLESARLRDGPVLDLYSGTGALGIEALSRGDDVPLRRGRHQDQRGDPREPGAHPLIDRGKVYPMHGAREGGRLKGPYTLWWPTRPMSMIGPKRSCQGHRAGVAGRRTASLVVEHSKRHDWPDELAGIPRVVQPPLR